MHILSWADVTGRYPELNKLPDIGSSTVQNSIMALGEAYIHSRCAVAYTVPFSSNNLTAIDLCIDAVYVQTQLTRQPDKADALNKSLDARIEALLAGKAMMITNSGDTIDTTIADVVWSSTMDYHPTFGMGAIERMAVSSSQLIDEDEARGGLGVAE
jgi:hypothetical protein